jgi:hypothetical protein
MSSTPHDRLARWLDEASTGEHPSAPEGLEQDVVEAVCVLRPELAPPPRVDIDDILASLTEGPLASSPGERADEAREAETLAAFLDGDSSSDLISDALAEGLFALRPELAPAPRVSMDDIFNTVTEGPFAQPDNVIPLTIAATTPTESGTESPVSAEVVPLSPRRRGSWWALPGLGALAAAAAALLVVQPLSLNEPPPDLAMERASYAPATVEPSTVEPSVAVPSAAATPSPGPPPPPAPQAEPFRSATEQQHAAQDPTPADISSGDGNGAVFSASIDELQQDYRNAPTGGAVRSDLPEVLEEAEESEEELEEAKPDEPRATATMRPEPEPEPVESVVAPRRAEEPILANRELSADLYDETVSESLGALGYIAGEDAAGAEAEGEVATRSSRDQGAVSASAEVSSKDEAQERDRAGRSNNQRLLGGVGRRYSSAPATEVYADAPAMAPMEDLLEAEAAGAEDMDMSTDMSSLRMAASQSLSSVPDVAAGRPELAAAYAESDALAVEGQLEAARAVLEPYRRSADPDVVLDVAWRRCALYLRRGLVVPGISALDEGLQAIGGDPRLRARLLYQKGQLLERRGDVTGATSAYGEATGLR